MAFRSRHPLYYINVISEGILSHTRITAAAIFICDAYVDVEVTRNVDSLVEWVIYPLVCNFFCHRYEANC